MIAGTSLRAGGNGVEGVEIKWGAFLSYAHNDAKWAKRLQDRLENLRINRDLVDRPTLRGPVSRVLTHIFRDRSDFTGGQELMDATITELDRSAALIILCSQFAAISVAVNEEVRLFRWRHPDRPVIPVIVGGLYPNNYPPALRYEVDENGNVTTQSATLLGADLRKEADGQELGFAKIVAGLTGLDTDTVYRRAERRRRHVRLLWALAAVLVGTIFGVAAKFGTDRFADFYELVRAVITNKDTDGTEGWYNETNSARTTLRQYCGSPFGRLGLRRPRFSGSTPRT